MNCSILFRQVRFVTAMRAWILALVFTLPSFATAQSLTFLVGGDADCDFTTIQAAINAAAAHAGPDFIHIAMNATYTAQALTIGSGDLEIDGGFATCASPTGTSKTTISGAGGSASSVFRITGSGGRVFRNLVITGGDAPFNGSGGGIDFNGTGEVNLGGVIVSGNYAGYGGGINASAAGGNAVLRLETDSVVINNTAQFSGGGIRVTGNTRLFMLANSTQVTGNEAIGIDPQNNQPNDGFGGGIEVIAPARADIGSPGFGNNGVIFNNAARYGGGIAVMGKGNAASAVARLFTVDPARPVRVHGNTASQSGGGVYMKPNRGIGETSLVDLCAFDFRIDDNAAQEGTAIYADSDTDSVGDTIGGFVFLNTENNSPGESCNVPESPPALGAVACTAGPLCNSIDSNIAQTAGGTATAGATVLMQSQMFGVLLADRVQLRDNRGGQVLRLTHDGVAGNNGIIADCLFADNVLTGPLILADDGADVELDNCTLTNNTIGAAYVVEASDAFKLSGSVLWQPGKLSLQSGGVRDVSNVLTSERFSLDSGSVATVLVADPRFIDPAHGDYHLQAASPAVDFSSAGGASDLDRHLRGVELPQVPNRFGSGDLGAYERQTLLPLVLNKDFDTDLRLWSVVTPGSATWNSDTAPGSSGGSVFVSVNPSVSDLVGLSQCIHIPGPGTYQLTGFGYGIGFGFQRDSVRLNWKYRANPGGEACTGAITGQGDLYLPGSSTWGAPLFPAIIGVPPGEWTRNSSVEVTLAVHENGVAVGFTSGFFDGVALEPLGDDSIFADDFEGP